MDEPWVWAIILLLAVLLFGSKRLPDAARGIGRTETRRFDYARELVPLGEAIPRVGKIEDAAFLTTARDWLGIRDTHGGEPPVGE